MLRGYGFPFEMLPMLPSQVGGNSLFGIEFVGGKSKTPRALGAER